MSVNITYFVHCTTTDNEARLATGWLPGKLSELGEEQSAILKEIVSDQEYDMVICSDLYRAIQTATIVFGDRYDITQDSRLRECNYGSLNGQPALIVKENMTGHIDVPFPDGESYKDVEKRISEFVSSLHENFEGKHVAIVAHQAPQLALDVLLKKLTWEQAIAQDWRNTKSYQPGWEYSIA